MPKAWAYMIAGILAGFGFLFFTVWSAQPDALTMAAVMFACASVIVVTGRSPRKGDCPKGPDMA